MSDAARHDSPLGDLLRELRQVLKDERAALLSGHPERIETITAHKLALVDQIEHAADHRSPQTELGALQTLARYNRENAVICSAMLRHMTAALDRLRQHDPHRSYLPDGSERNPPTQRLVGAA